MAHSDTETIEIKDESDGLPKFVLYVDGCPRAQVTRAKNGDVKLNWAIYGPIYWQESKVILQGLLELGVYADKLEGKRK